MYRTQKDAACGIFSVINLLGNIYEKLPIDDQCLVPPTTSSTPEETVVAYLLKLLKLEFYKETQSFINVTLRTSGFPFDNVQTQPNGNHWVSWFVSGENIFKIDPNNKQNRNNPDDKMGSIKRYSYEDGIRLIETTTASPSGLIILRKSRDNQHRINGKLLSIIKDNELNEVINLSISFNDAERDRGYFLYNQIIDIKELKKTLEENENKMIIGSELFAVENDELGNLINQFEEGGYSQDVITAETFRKAKNRLREIQTQTTALGGGGKKKRRKISFKKRKNKRNKTEKR